MTPERLQRLEELYHAARERQPDERQAFLTAACAGDEELRRVVESLLVQDGGGVMGQPALEIAANLLGDATETRWAIGTELGPYRIEALLGAGGMGQVFKACDTRLGRAVALKVVHERFSARFEREARVISALNHPHICTLYDVGALPSGSGYLVMELVEGETLAAKLKKGKLTIPQTLQYGAQVAEALAEAHAKGIVHRDLKPANIMLAKRGVKVLDFGIAKSQEDETLTASRVAVGTPAYMAPEQRAGRDCDTRTDIYALGLVLHEMATGRRPSEDASAALRSLPERLAHVIGRCLEPDPESRWQSARDVSAELEWAREPEPTTTAAQPGRRWWTATAIIFVLAALGGWAIAHFRQPAADERVVRFQIDPPEGGQFPLAGSIGGIALSPDGKTVAYVASVNGKSGLWVRPLDGTTARPLAGTEGAAHPFWSADSKSIAFFNIRRLQRVEAAGGGEPLTICDALTLGEGGSWSANGQIVFGLLNSPLFRVPASGGKPVPLTTLNQSRGEIGHSWPQMLPGGRLLYWVLSDKPEDTGVYAASLAKPDERIKLLTSDANALYAALPDAKSYLLWVRGQALVAQEFNPTTFKLAGEPHPVADPVSKGGQLNASIGNGGVLLYSAFGSSNGMFTWFDRAGKPLGTVGDPDGYSTFRLSPDGRRAVATRHRSGDNNLFLLDMATHLPSRFTLNSSFNVFPIWSPNGRTILYTATRSLFRKDSDGVGNEELVIPSQNPQYATDWSGDGRLVLYMETAPGTQDDLWILRVTPDGKAVPGTLGQDPNPRPYLRTPADELNGRFSPEPSPRWVVYESNESGPHDVYIAAFPNPRNKIRISRSGGEYPQWGAKGRELFYVAPGNKLMAVSLKLGPDSVEPSAPRELFVLPFLDESHTSPYDAAPDGQRFLVRATPPPASQPLTVILNWPALLKNGVSAP
jgi:Tol biopolymer transport system component